MSQTENIISGQELAVKAFKITEAFEKYGVYIKIKEGNFVKNRMLFWVKLKRNTRKDTVRKYMKDVQMRLQFAVFVLQELDYELIIVASEQEIKSPKLEKYLIKRDYAKYGVDMELPYFLGLDVFGEPCRLDLADCPHLLIGGASNSGKTVGLKALILSMAWYRSPARLRFILLDLGAMDLVAFKELPHLTCPIIQNPEDAFNALNLLNREMERRIRLEHENPVAYNRLPRLVLVVDEFPALFSSAERKERVKVLEENISNLLRRGRHARIHVCLSAQNPTLKNMKVDLSNITARIAFKCAKRNFSETILGEAGAENLTKKGELLIKCPALDGVQQIQGAYVESNHLPLFIEAICKKWSLRPQFFITEADLTQRRAEIGRSPQTDLRGRQNQEQEKLAQVLLWTLSQTAISCNTIMSQFKVGWARASKFVDQLCQWGIISELDAKLPREVLPHSPEEIPSEAVDFLTNYIEPEAIAEVFDQQRNG